MFFSGNKKSTVWGNERAQGCPADVQTNVIDQFVVRRHAPRHRLPQVAPGLRRRSDVRRTPRSGGGAGLGTRVGSKRT